VEENSDSELEIRNQQPQLAGSWGCRVRGLLTGGFGGRRVREGGRWHGHAGGSDGGTGGEPF